MHGVIKTISFELAFGQPPRQSIFPGVVKSKIMEEDIKHILKEEDDKVKDENQRSDDENQGDDKNDKNNRGQVKDKIRVVMRSKTTVAMRIRTVMLRI